MSTSGDTISVTPPRSLWVSNSGSASAPGRLGPSAQAPASTTAPAQTMAGTVVTSGCSDLPSTVRGSTFEALAQQGEGAEAGADHGEAGDDPPLVDAEGGDEHEQHGTGDERLAAGLGPEGERVGEPHRRRHRRSGEERPAAGVLDRRRRRLEVVADDTEVGTHGLPRVGEREHAGERVGVVHPRHQPGEHDEHERDGDERRERGAGACRYETPWPTTAMSTRSREEVPPDEHLAEPDRHGDRVGDHPERRREVETERLVALVGRRHRLRRRGDRRQARARDSRSRAGGATVGHAALIARQAPSSRWTDRRSPPALPASGLTLR